MDSFYDPIFANYNLKIKDNYDLIFENTLTGNIDTDVEILNQSYNGKNILLMYDTNPVWWFEDYFARLAEQVNYVYLASANLANFWNQDPKIVYFPTFLLTQKNHDNHQSFEKSYRFSFLSNKPRLHRIYFYYVVRNYITDNDVFSVNNSAFNRDWWYQQFKSDMLTTIGDYYPEIEETLPFITDNAHKCNLQLNTLGDLINDHSNKHIAYNAYFNVTGETDNTPGKIFVTEKTWKAVRSGTLPIFLDIDSFDYMAKLGFNFENEINIKKTYLDKVRHLKDCFKNISMLDAKDVYQRNLSTVKENIKLYHSNHLLNKFIDQIYAKLDLTIP